MKLFIICLILPSLALAQANQTEAYYVQASKKFDSVKTIPSDSIKIPSVNELDRSPAANEYLHLEMVAALRYEAGHHPDRDELKRWVGQIFGITIDSIQHLSARLGDDYVVWLYARHLLSPAVQERYLVHRVDWHVKEQELTVAKAFFSELELYFSRSGRIGVARVKVQALEAKVMAGKRNTHILYRGPVHSLDELIAPYKGKVVYLDIWGTWCGPCREEMKYAPALKQHVDGSQVVFVYLDMDADENDGKWREYVQLHGITGEHLRMNSADLEVIWEALLHTSGGPRSYPGYFIFGRDGKVVETNAKRPSEKEALYARLKEVVEQR